jgi:hypothetical protein
MKWLCHSIISRPREYHPIPTLAQTMAVESWRMKNFLMSQWRGGNAIRRKPLSSTLTFMQVIHHSPGVKTFRGISRFAACDQARTYTNA